MKTIARLIAVLVIAAVASFHLVSCSSPNTGDVLAKASAASDNALKLLAAAEATGKIKAVNADKLRAEIASGKAIAATLGKLDFSNARTLAAELAATGALPPDIALAIQGALLISDLAGL